MTAPARHRLHPTASETLRAPRSIHNRPPGVTARRGSGSRLNSEPACTPCRICNPACASLTKPATRSTPRGSRWLRISLAQIPGAANDRALWRTCSSPTRCGRSWARARSRRPWTRRAFGPARRRGRRSPSPPASGCRRRRFRSARRRDPRSCGRSCGPCPSWRERRRSSSARAPRGRWSVRCCTAWGRAPCAQSRSRRCWCAC